MAGETTKSAGTGDADAASVKAATKAMQRRISNEKEQFTRRDNNILSMKEKGDGTIANTALSQLDKKAEVILNLFYDLIEMCPADDIAAHGAAKAKADKI